MPKFIDLTGRKFTRLTVIKRGPNKKNATRWRCICDCGTTTLVHSYSLLKETSKSCGCLKNENTAKLNVTHGMSHHPLYSVWFSMVGRCTNPKKPDYPRYGGRGITVCEQWMSFSNFYADMGERPDGTSIDRIDNNKGYYPSNCRWASHTVQARNKNNNHIVEYNGEAHCVTEWAEITGITADAIHFRLKRGWSAEKTLTTPVRIRSVLSRND